MAIAFCRNCDKQFIPTNSSRGIFCSLDCYHKAMIGKPHGHKTRNGMPPWNKGLKLPEQSRENHFRFITDRTQLKRQDRRDNPLYKEWRMRVWNRDNFKCLISNGNCNGRIEAHHILGYKDFPELRYEINNGITLCHAHHPRKRIEEQKLAPIFQEMIKGE